MTIGAESIQNAISAMVQDWLSHHPVLGWGMTHPLWAIAALLLILFLAWGLLGAIARLMETLWIELLRTPLKLSRWGVARLRNLLRHSTNEPPSILNVSHTHPLHPKKLHAPVLGLDKSVLDAQRNHQQPQLSEVVARLEQLQREQIKLLQDVRVMLYQTSSMTIPPHLPTVKDSDPQKTTLT
jgi:hypothetical protein